MESESVPENDLPERWSPQPKAPVALIALVERAGIFENREGNRITVHSRQ